MGINIKTYDDIFFTAAMMFFFSHYCKNDKSVVQYAIL